MKQISYSTTELKNHRRQLVEELPKLRGQHIVVVGDVGLDEYLSGDVRRLSPEAPVPILDVTEQREMLGLAGNVSQNVVTLGGKSTILGVVGKDTGAGQLRSLFKSAGVTDDFLIEDTERPTTRKTRIMAGQHHIVRVDFEKRRYVSDKTQKEMLGRYQELLKSADAVIIEDYAKGLLTEATLQTMIQLAHEKKLRVLIDPHVSTPLSFYKNADLITPNRQEAFALAKINADDWRTSDQVLEVGTKLRKELSSPHVIITRGQEGMSLFSEVQTVHMPTFAKQVFDVTGAGDTVIAALALGWTAGIALEQACVLANVAAGIVVGKVGCVPCTAQELKDALQE